MGQTGVIFFALLVGFIVFITVRGELAAYLWVVGLSNQKPALGGVGGTGLNVTLPTIKL